MYNMAEHNLSDLGVAGEVMSHNSVVKKVNTVYKLLNALNAGCDLSLFGTYLCLPEGTVFKSIQKRKSKEY